MFHTTFNNISVISWRCYILYQLFCFAFVNFVLNIYFIYL